MGPFHQNTFDLLEAIEDTLEKRRLLPCLALVFTGIDVMASLDRRKGEGTKAAFTRWADSYLLKARELPCTALELYAARCGIVHTFSANSDLSNKGARKIIYAWGNREASDLQEASRISKQAEYIAIHIRDLIWGFRQGLADYLDEISGDAVRQKAFDRQVGEWFTGMDPKLVDEVIEKARAQKL